MSIERQQTWGVIDSLGDPSASIVENYVMRLEKRIEELERLLRVIAWEDLDADAADAVTVLDWLPPHKCGLYLEHNPHRDVYESVIDQYDADSFPTPEDLQQAVDTGEVWQLQWYPETPIGFHVIAAPTLERLIKVVRSSGAAQGPAGSSQP